jgi:hypothetical protein
MSIDQKPSLLIKQTNNGRTQGKTNKQTMKKCINCEKIKMNFIGIYLLACKLIVKLSSAKMIGSIYICHHSKSSHNETLR